MAVNLNGPVQHLPKQPAKEMEGSSYWEWFPKFPVTGKRENTAPPKVLPKISLFDLLNTSYDFTQDRLTEMMIHHHTPDILIEVPRNSCNVFEFYRANELIEAGKNAYRNAMTNKSN